MGSLKKFDGSSWVNSNLRKLTTDTDTFTTFPAIIYAEGTNATVGLKGNTVQSSTPTPDTPVMPQGTGDKTANLFDKSKRTDNSRVVYTTGEIDALNGVFVSDFTPIEPNTTYTLNIVSSISGKTGHLFALYDENKNFVNTGAHEATPATVYTFTTPSNVAYIRFNGNMASADEIMFNSGSTPLPYESYGYKIPISSANTTTPVYLGEVEATRRIKKLVLTGEENIKLYNYTDVTRFGIYVGDSTAIGGICTHYVWLVQSGGSEDHFYTNSSGNVFIFSTTISTVYDFKAYLAAQYDAGTPVTVWYVLATEETAVVNEPLMRIGDCADTVSGISIPVTAGGDTLSVGTTVQPSEVTANYYGWHTITVHERESGQWD